MDGKERKNKSHIVIVALLLASAVLLISPAFATSTTISIGNIFVKSGEVAVGSIKINNVTNLGVADINLTFDNSVVHVLSVNNSDFDFFHAVIDNSTGVVRIGGIDYGDGLNGNIKLAAVTLKAIGNHGETSALHISINVLKEAGAIETPIPATEEDGTVFLNRPPIAIPTSVHRHNNVGSEYQCKALFNASASYDPDSDDIANYTWDFGDGYFDEGSTTEHAYSSYKWNGTGYEPFNVSLTVKDAGGLANTTIMQVNVYIAGDANGDGEVDIVDGSIVGLEFWETCSDGSWDTDRKDMADLNNDCEVDIMDATIVGVCFWDTAW